jgi:hypothetical protein
LHLKKVAGSLTERFGLNPLQCAGFELDPKHYVVIELTVEERKGTAAYNFDDTVVVGDRDNVPRRIIFRAPAENDTPSLTIGIEVRGGAPTVTYLELSAGDGADVRAKHLRPIHLEECVNQIVVLCNAHYVVFDPDKGPMVYQPEVTRDDVRAVERMQRRRRDPRTDRELLERVAELYRQHPEAPNQAVAAAFEVSERTAARWAGYCSEAELLPKAPKQGQKRL